MNSIYAVIGSISVALLGCNGIIYFLVARHFNNKDKTRKLQEVNNRQADELVVLGNVTDLLIEGQERLVDALHDKGVLNGNSIEIKNTLNQARNEIRIYTKSKKDKGLFV